MRIVLLEKVFKYNSLRKLFHTLGLWPRLALTIGLGFFLFFGIFAFFSLHIIKDSTNRILEERQVLTQMAANQIDAILTQAFHELEKATSFARFDPKSSNLNEEYHMLAHAYGRIGTLSLGVYFLDAGGKVIFVEPFDERLVGYDYSHEPHIQGVMASRQRTVSAQFLEPRTGRPTVALTIPIKDGRGQLVSMLSGLVDLTNPQIRSPIEQAKMLGNTGHAEIVDSQGKVIASTYPETFLMPGEHSTFYKHMMLHKVTGIETVPYENGVGEGKTMHVMAFVPLSMAEWGIALGGDVRETFAPVVALRNSIFFFGGMMLVVILSATLLGARHLIRPVRQLTVAAQDIARGDLDRPIHPSAGGEIGILEVSLEEMRLKLKEAIEQIRGWNLELEEKVEERTSELQKLMEEVSRLHAMQELDRLKSEFVSSVSHELRTPLGFIKGYATTLLRPDVPHSEEVKREFLQIIAEESDKLQELVENLLDTSRIQTGAFIVDKKPSNIEELAKQVMTKAQTTTTRHSFLFKFDTLPEVQADPRRLEQVLQNLLDNAIKYSPNGGLISIKGKQEGNFVQISINDEGPGVPRAELENIFEPFYRLAGADHQRVRGVGLGLTICRAIIEAHGGRIWAESVPGKGSVFSFTLPLREDSNE